MDTMILLVIALGFTAWAIAEITTYLFGDKERN